MKDYPIKWSTLKLPTSLYEEIKKLSKQEGLVPHKFLAKCVTTYKSYEKVFERRLWYAFKLMLVYGDFRSLVRHGLADEKIMRSLDYVLYQIEDRIKVINREEREAILKLAEEYMNTKSNRVLYKLNDKIRDVFFKILAYQ